MKVIKQIFGVLLTIVLFTFSSCEKEEGPQGPTGPSGPSGPAGNANVHSNVFTVAADAWIEVGYTYYSQISYSAITQDIVDHGAVLVYEKGQGDIYIQLPYTFYLASSYSSTLDAAIYVGGVRIIRTDSDLTLPATQVARTFKIVTIAGSAMKANPNVNLNNYIAVKEAFHLKE